MGWQIANNIHAAGRFAPDGTRLSHSPNLGNAMGHIPGSGVYQIPVSPPISPRERCVLVTCERDNVQQFYVGQIVEPLSTDELIVIETFFSTQSPLTPADTTFNVAVIRTGG